MRRLKDYCKFVAWQTGIGYLMLWAVTFWTLDEGATVFGKSGVCVPDQAKVLFYWVCDASSPLTILASVANAALTATVWAPVYIAAATAQPDAVTIAGAIIALHVIGLPLGIFVLVRMLVIAFGLRRPSGANPAGAVGIAPAAAMPVVAAATPAGAPAARPVMPPRLQVKPRDEFGLRGRDDSR
jgi:hypothetical protein